MSNSLSSLCSSTRVLFTKKGAVIKKAMLAAAVVSLAGLGLNTPSAEAGYSCTNTDFGRHCTGTFNGGKTYRKLCRATIFGTEYS